MPDASAFEETAGASATGASSNTGATQTSSGAETLADIDTGERFKAAMADQKESWSHNLKRLADAYQQLDLKLAQDYADMGMERARKAQTMWEDTHSEMMKDLAEIRSRRLNQFDVAVRDHWNKEEELQDDIATHATLQKLIDALNAAEKKAAA